MTLRERPIFLLVNLLNHAANKNRPKLRISGPLWGESACHDGVFEFNIVEIRMMSH